MKVCRLCNERYRDLVDFCFVDGEVLVFEADLAHPGALPTSPPELDAPPPPAWNAAPPPYPDPDELDELEELPLALGDQVTSPRPNPSRPPVSSTPEPAMPVQTITAPFVRPPPSPSSLERTPVPVVTQRRGPAADAPPKSADEVGGGNAKWILAFVVLPVLLAAGVGVGALLGVGGTAAWLGTGSAPQTATVAEAVPAPARAAAPPAPAPELVAVPAPSAPEAPEPAAAVAPAPAPAPIAAPTTPEPAAVAAKVGSLRLVSVPPGAEVKIDARSVGRTPATVDLAHGAHDVTLTLEGYQAWSGTVSLSVASLEYPAIALRPVAPAPAPVADTRKGKVFLTYSETGATVWVDGVLVGDLPVLYELSGGEHQFKIQGASGTTNLSRTVVLKEQGTTTVFLGE